MSPVKRVLIVPGWKATPRSSWFPWLAERLIAEGHSASVLEMPRPWTPSFRDWTPTIRNAVGTPDSNTVLVGHSTGAVAILRYIETLPPHEKLGGVVLVSAFPHSLFHRRVPHLLTRRPRPSAIIGKVGWILAVQSDNDWRVPISNADWLRDELGAEVIVLAGAGHITRKSGHAALPEDLYRRIVELIGTG